LRQRKEDILPLAEHILRKTCQDNHKKPKTLSTEAIHILLNHPWPGNVREMQHLLEHTVLLHDDEVIRGEDLRLHSRLRRSHSLDHTLAELEERTILATLAELKNNRTAVAKKLGISIRTLRNKLKSYC
jgi:DNA-binding NtrC family response regulator